MVGHKGKRPRATSPSVTTKKVKKLGIRSPAASSSHTAGISAQTNSVSVSIASSSSKAPSEPSKGASLTKEVIVREMRILVEKEDKCSWAEIHHLEIIFDALLFLTSSTKMHKWQTFFEVGDKRNPNPVYAFYVKKNGEFPRSPNKARQFGYILDTLKPLICRVLMKLAAVTQPLRLKKDQINMLLTTDNISDTANKFSTNNIAFDHVINLGKSTEVLLQAFPSAIYTNQPSAITLDDMDATFSSKLLCDILKSKSRKGEDLTNAETTLAELQGRQVDIEASSQINQRKIKLQQQLIEKIKKQGSFETFRDQVVLILRGEGFEISQVQEFTNVCKGFSLMTLQETNLSLAALNSGNT